MNSPLVSSPAGPSSPTTTADHCPIESTDQRFVSRGRSGVLIDILHLFVLSSFAISQTVYDHITREPGLVAQNITNFGALVAFVLAVAFVVPLTLTVVELLAGLFGKSGRETTHVILIAVLLMLLILPVLNRYTATWRAIYVLITAVVLAALAAFAYASVPRIKSVLTVASPAILIFPGVFLCNSPVTKTLLAADGAHTAAGKPIPVVMVVFDEFCGEWLKQADQEIDASRYPNFARLAATSNWYRNATAVHAQTAQAVPSLMTGKRVRSEPPPILAEHPYNLLDLMARSRSHEPVIFEPYTQLAPEIRARYVVESTSPLLPTYKLAPTLGLVYLHYICPVEERSELPEIPREWFGLRNLSDVNRLQRSGVVRWPWTNRRDEQLDHFLDCIRPGPDPENPSNSSAIRNPENRPQFLFLHAVLPHVPMAYLPSGRRYLDDIQLGSLTAQVGAAFSDASWRKDELAVSRAHQRFLLQLGYVDEFVGRLTERLREVGVFDDCLLIITADHGVSFRALLSRRDPRGDSLPDVLSVPLFVKLPGQKSGRISDRNVETIDVLPTIAQLLELPLPIAPEGQSILDEKLPERAEKKLIHGAEYVVPGNFPSKRFSFDLLQQRFGTGNGWGGVYALGPQQELVGRKVSDLAAGSATGAALEFQLEIHATNCSVSPRGFVPSFFAGWATPTDSREYPLTMAIAVNGVIQGVTRTYDLQDKNTASWDSGLNRWEFLVPESAFRPGENQVDYYLIRGTGPQLKLHPIQK